MVECLFHTIFSNLILLFIFNYRASPFNNCLNLLFSSFRIESPLQIVYWFHPWSPYDPSCPSTSVGRAVSWTLRGEPFPSASSLPSRTSPSRAFESFRCAASRGLRGAGFSKFIHFCFQLLIKRLIHFIRPYPFVPQPAWFSPGTPWYQSHASSSTSLPRSESEHLKVASNFQNKPHYASSFHPSVVSLLSC